MGTTTARGAPGEVFAVLRHLDARWMGRLLPVKTGPPRFAFPRVDDIDRVPLGTFLTLGVASRAMGRTAQCLARLMAMELAADSVAVEVELDDPRLWREAVPEAVHQATNRRAWPRIHPRPGGDVVVPMIAQGRRLAGLLLDASPGGMGVRLPRQAEAVLCQCDELIAILPHEHDETIQRRCGVRHRRLLPVGVRYGLSFRDPVEAGPCFQPQWTCGHCGADPMLRDTHTHCLRCGTARGTSPTRLPDWDDLLTEEDHPLTGVARTCLRCGGAWGAGARNCGHCGTRLPQHA